MMVVLAKNESLASSWVTTPLNVTGIDGFCAVISVSATTGGAIGRFAVYGSVDNITYVELTQTSVVMDVIGVDIVYKLNFLEIQDSWIQIAWISASGDGSATIDFTAKAIGGTGRVAW